MIQQIQQLKRLKQKLYSHGHTVTSDSEQLKRQIKTKTKKLQIKSEMFKNSLNLIKRHFSCTAEQKLFYSYPTPDILSVLPGDYGSTDYQFNSTVVPTRPKATIVH